MQPLNRWVRSSLLMYFQTKFPEIVSTGFEQNSPETYNQLKGEVTMIELQLNGPSTRMRSNKRARHNFDIRVLLTQSKTTNIYTMDELLDSVRSAFKDTFCIYEIDKDNQDPPFTLVGALKCYKGFRNEIRSFNFGQIDNNIPLFQGAVTGRYYIDLPN